MVRPRRRTRGRLAVRRPLPATDWLTGHGPYVVAHPGSAVMCAAISADGNRALAAGGTNMLPAIRTEIRLWDLQTGRELHRFRALLLSARELVVDAASEELGAHAERSSFIDH